ncbi:DUF4296 domain-containing protein [Flavobacterium sp.]|uniref:DUF4296 domain-containing protein n=1 Tax=Flavobacterium sp. TaxID=239 RepID=UPI0038FD17F3
MYKGIFFAFLVSFVFSCQKPAVEKPVNLIDKEVMVDIMYDLSLLEAIKYQDSSPLKEKKITPYQFINYKYQVDSTRFVKSNMYYASDYKVYKKLFDEINARLDKNKSLMEINIKKEKEKTEILKKAKKKLKEKKAADSIAKIKNIKKDL